MLHEMYRARERGVDGKITFENGRDIAWLTMADSHRGEGAR